MKTNHKLFIFLIFPVFIFGQKKYKYSYKEGYGFLAEAQKMIKEDKIKSAKILINKAKRTNYGFCGNAWIDANSQITLLEVQVLNKENNYDQSLNILDSLDECSYGADCDTRDYLKIETLILKFGKEKVKNAFKNVNKVSIINDYDYGESYSAFIKDLNYNFNFTARQIIFVDENGKKVPKNVTDNEFLNIAQNQPFYSLLKE
ncbi:hypothetical protein HNP38_003106 [Chryseobacterium defluvii]|uniref:Uncharacterized protein n=1 Tax=Chryseobacterium defluvii TaxID=160396 RepID=A0A840KJV7_9FLAO|nr:hypothetical protein [Chryseobacterium defluvii]MBB4807790.1 hypothetical protein [Chryseobacterium defluvii]